MEGRLLERLDNLSSQIGELNRRLSELEEARGVPGSEAAARVPRAARGPEKAAPGKANPARGSGS